MASRNSYGGAFRTALSSAIKYSSPTGASASGRHDFWVVRVPCDKVVALSDGCVVESDDCATVAAKLPRRYKGLW
jgi:hypothetical protein